MTVPYPVTLVNTAPGGMLEVTAVSVKEPIAVALTLKVTRDPGLQMTNDGANKRGPKEKEILDADELPVWMESPG